MVGREEPRGLQTSRGGSSVVSGCAAQAGGSDQQDVEGEAGSLVERGLSTPGCTRGAPSFSHFVLSLFSESFPVPWPAGEALWCLPTAGPA